MSIEIPNSVTDIGYGAFSGCTGITSIAIPNSVTSIGASAFSGCTSLTSIAIPNSVTSIGFFAFSDCTGLTDINLLNEDPAIVPISESTFNRVNLSQITLVVPIGTGYAYRHHPLFAKFKEVKAIL